jgi:hypothetical protein
MVKKNKKNLFTTTTMVGICRQCTKQTKHDPRQNHNPSMTSMACSHRRPNNDDGAKEDNNNGPAGDIGCGNHFVSGMVVFLMGSGVMTMTTTKSDEDAHPPQDIEPV